MAIRLIEGVPGSGKTYYAVAHLVKNYFEKQSDGRYELIKPCTIITNIENFRPDHVSLQDVMHEAGGAKKFFTEPYQVEFSKKFDSQIVYIIDEVQQYFRKGDRDKDLADVFYYFEKHRHLGHDIYLITQSVKKLPTDITTLVEYIIIAAPRSRNVVGEFKYKWDSDGIILKREAFKPDKAIFALYKSMDADETEKVKNPLKKTILILFIFCFIIGSFLIYHLWYNFVGKHGKNESIIEYKKPEIEISKYPKGMPSDGLFIDYHEVLVSSVTNIEISNGMQHVRVLIVFQDMLWPKEIFPFPLRKFGNSYYAKIPSVLYDEIKGKGNVTRDDVSTEAM